MEAQRPHITQSCRSCRRLKRRCTKELPRCSLCTRVGRACEYPELLPHSPLSSPADAQSSPTVLSGARTRQYRSRDFSRAAVSRTPDGSERTTQEGGVAVGAKAAAWFLDSVAMRGRQNLLQQVDIEWTQITDILPPLGSAEASHILSQYRGTVHNWLPCISIKSLTRQLALQDVVAAADKTAMLYAMKLMACKLSSETDDIHSAVLMAIDFCEASSCNSTNLLAAQVLLAFWELGQGLFPATYHSLSRCARSCYVAGLHDKRKATQLLPKADSWTEVEERRRLWWAVIILDRYIHAGFRFRPLAIPAISPQEIIPADDAAWDEGIMAVNPLLVMSIEAATIVSPYARLCQAAHLLGSVCQHVNEHPIAEEADFHFQEADRLSRATLALLTMLEEEQRVSDQPQSRFAARALCYSALLLLYDVHSCVEVDEIEACGGNRGLRLDLQQLALDGMQDISSRVCAFAEEVLFSYGQNSIAGSPLVLNCIYSAAGVYAWYVRERGDETDLEKFSKLKSVLRQLQERWRVAGQYSNAN